MAWRTSTTTARSGTPEYLRNSAVHGQIAFTLRSRRPFGLESLHMLSKGISERQQLTRCH
jgi:hypothetical protein